jgi:hypothetical protein
MRKVHMNKGRVGEDRGSKETDRCPLTRTIRMEWMRIIVRATLTVLMNNTSLKI